MSDNFTNTRLLIRYLDRELAADEHTALELRLSSNPLLSHELQNLRHAQEAVSRFGLQQQVASVHSLMMLEFKNGNLQPRAGRRILRMTMRIAAILVFVIAGAGMYYYVTLSSGKLANENYAAYSFRTERGLTTSVSAIEEAYQQKKFDTVIYKLKSTPSPTVKEYFFGGLAYFEKNDAPGAIMQFNSLIEKNNRNSTTDFHEEAEYYLALSYLKNNDASNALPLFEKIHGDKLHRYHDKVSRWFIRKLKILRWKQN